MAHTQIQTVITHTSRCTDMIAKIQFNLGSARLYQKHRYITEYKDSSVL